MAVEAVASRCLGDMPHLGTYSSCKIKFKKYCSYEIDHGKSKGKIEKNAGRCGKTVDDVRRPKLNRGSKP